MNQSELDQARAEVDPEERAFRDLMALGRQYLGIILLAEKLGEASTLRGVMEAAQRSAEQARARLAGLNDAIGAAEVAEAEQRTEFDAARKERERILASVNQQIKGADAQATEIVAEAERKASSIVVAAQQDYNAAIAKAEAMAEDIQAAARVEAQRLMKTASEWADESKRAIAANQATLRDLEQAAAKAEKRVQAARETIARMVAQ